MLALEPLRLLLELGHALLGIELVGGHHHRLGLRRLGLGQSLQDVAQLVRAAALHAGAFAEHLVDRAAQRPGAIDHEQVRHRLVEPALDQPAQQSEAATTTRAAAAPRPT